MMRAKSFARASMLSLAAAGLLLAGCGLGEDPGQITLKWSLGFGVPCDHVQAGVTNVRVRVTVAESGRELTPAVFACGAGSGVVGNVPAGTYNLVVEGGPDAQLSSVSFRGSVGGVIVAPGATVDIGTVTLEKLPPSQNPGTLKIAWRFENGLCGANNVATVRLQIWRELVYREHDKQYPCDVKEGFVSVSLSPATYGVVLEGISADGKAVKRASADDVRIQQGETVDLTGDKSVVLR